MNKYLINKMCDFNIPSYKYRISNELSFITKFINELANMILCEALPSIISFLPTNVINLVINDNKFEILFIT